MAGGCYSRTVGGWSPCTPALATTTLSRTCTPTSTCGPRSQCTTAEDGCYSGNGGIVESISVATTPTAGIANTLRRSTLPGTTGASSRLRTATASAFSATVRDGGSPNLEEATTSKSVVVEQVGKTHRFTNSEADVLPNGAHRYYNNGSHEKACDIRKWTLDKRPGGRYKWLTQQSVL